MFEGNELMDDDCSNKVEITTDTFMLVGFKCNYDKFHDIHGRILKNIKTREHFVQVYELTLTDWYLDEIDKGNMNYNAEKFSSDFKKYLDRVKDLQDDGHYIACCESDKFPTKDLIVKNLTERIREGLSDV